MGLALAVFVFNLFLTGWSVALVVAGLLLRNGLGAENLAWGIMFLFLPLTCVYYPVSVLPDWLQIFAWMLPPTYVFEGMRALLVDKVFRADLMLQALALNAVVFAGSTIAFLACSRAPAPMALCCRAATNPRKSPVDPLPKNLFIFPSR